jgi:hypothetical protein
MSRLEAFSADVSRSGLVTPAALARARSVLPPIADGDAPVVLARLLIQSGAVTPYQARKLLAGATRGFFLGGYRILRRLGEGGMGKVYLAQPEGGGARRPQGAPPSQGRGRRAVPPPIPARDGAVATGQASQPRDDARRRP